MIILLGGGFTKYFWNFHPYLFGEDEAILTSIFFNGVETTTYKVGPLPVISGVISPINGYING